MSGSPSSARLEGLQQLRFFAALLVLIHHVLEELHASPLVQLPYALTTVGACGVDIFFVISGYVMWHSTRGFAEGVSPLGFLRRRFFRIYPIYWFCLGLLLLIWASGIGYRSLQLSPVLLFSSLSLIPGIDRDSSLIVGVAWTLVYEMYFYAVCTMALCLRPVRLRPLFILLLLGGLPVLAGLAGWHSGESWYADPIVLEFCFGLGLGALHAPAGRKAWHAPVLIAACFMMVAACLWWPDAKTAGLSDSVRWLAWGVPAALIVAVSTGRPFAGGRTGRWLTGMGDASYTLYLSHGFVMIVLARLLKGALAESMTAVVVAGVLAVIGACVLGRLMHVHVERRLTDYLKH
ncbi:acyltransferase family protein [Uliginosibacterium paludis]|uniref:Acyltransferase n=1 Tax=Uliginosibacterium paludis TaxID=1615952 RepID=A0ABV2CPV1_9RHOO